MASVKGSQPAHYMNGLSNNIYLTTKHQMSSNPVEIINERNYDLSDSDIDGHSINQSFVSNQCKVETNPKRTVLSRSKDDNSLMQWLVQQFQQNGIERDPQTELDVKENIESNYLSSLCKNEELYVGSKSQIKPVNGTQNYNSTVGQERWAKSCTRLDSVKPVNGIHYPRMQRSRDTSLRRPSKDTVESVNHLLDEINRKAEDMKSNNYRINQQLQKATAIISHLKYSQQLENSQSRERSNSTPTGNYSRYEQGRRKETPLLKLKWLNNTKINSAQSLLSRSAYPDSATDDMDQSLSQISDTKTLTVHRLRSENRFIMDDRLPQSTPSPWNSSKLYVDDVRLRETSTAARYPITRRYSSTQQAEQISIRDEYRESSLGPLNANTHNTRGSNNVTNTSSNTSKFSWIGRALSQLSLAEWPGRSKAESKTTPKPACSGATPEIYNNLSPSMNSSKSFSTMVRRPFHRKANSPSPGPLTISPPIVIHKSVQDLNGSSPPTSIDEEEELVQNISRTCPKDSFPMQTEEREQNISFKRNGLTEQFVERLNRQDGLPSKDRIGDGIIPSRFPKAWKRELDIDSGKYTIDTDWRY